MKKYIGTKIIEAEVMSRGEYNKYRGWKIPENENPDEEGFLVKYPDRYESWSPKKQFEEAYRECDNMTFGLAVEAMKKGYKVARKGWNGRGIFIELRKSECDLEAISESVHNAWWEEKKKQGVAIHPDMLPYNELSEEVKECDRVTVRTVIEAIKYMTHPYLYINTTGLQTDNPVVLKNRVPWFASQTDMLSEDWYIV